MFQAQRATVASGRFSEGRVPARLSKVMQARRVQIRHTALEVSRRFDVSELSLFRSSNRHDLYSFLIGPSTLAVSAGDHTFHVLGFNGSSHEMITNLVRLLGVPESARSNLVDTTVGLAFERHRTTLGMRTTFENFIVADGDERTRLSIRPENILGFIPETQAERHDEKSAIRLLLESALFTFEDEYLVKESVHPSVQKAADFYKQIIQTESKVSLERALAYFEASELFDQSKQHTHQYELALRLRAHCLIEGAHILILLGSRYNHAARLALKKAQGILKAQVKRFSDRGRGDAAWSTHLQHPAYAGLRRIDQLFKEIGHQPKALELGMTLFFGRVPVDVPQTGKVYELW